jgi:hypothetical protein
MEPCTPNNCGSKKWASNLDLLAASKYFNINVIVCERSGDGFRWQFYNPHISKKVIVIINTVILFN